MRPNSPTACCIQESNSNPPNCQSNALPTVISDAIIGFYHPSSVDEMKSENGSL